MLTTLPVSEKKKIRPLRVARGRACRYVPRRHERPALDEAVDHVGGEVEELHGDEEDEERAPPPRGVRDGAKPLQQHQGYRGLDACHGDDPDGDGEVGKHNRLRGRGEGDQAWRGEHFKAEQHEGYAWDRWRRGSIRYGRVAHLPAIVVLGRARSVVVPRKRERPTLEARAQHGRKDSWGKGESRSGVFPGSGSFSTLSETSHSPIVLVCRLRHDLSCFLVCCPCSRMRFALSEHRRTPQVAHVERRHFL